MKLVVGSKSFEVASIEEASARYEQFRGHKPSSRMRDGQIFDGDVQIARVSYNAKVWAPKPWSAGDEPLFNPYEQTDA